MDKSTKKLLSGSMIYFFGNAMTQLLSLVLLRFVTGRITPEEYGAYNLIVTVTNLVMPFFTLQISDAVFKFILAAKSEEEKKKYYTITFFVSIGSVILTIGSVYIADTFFFDIPYCFLTALYMAFTAVFTIYQRIVRSMGCNKVFVAGNLIRTIVYLSAEIFLIYTFDMGAEAIFISIIASYIIFLIFVELQIKSRQYLDFKCFDRQALGQMTRFSLPLIPNAVFWWLTSSINTVIVSTRCGLDVNGIYTVANKFSSVLVMVTSVFAMSWQETALSEYGDAKFKQFFTKTFNMYYVGVFSVIAILIAFMQIIFPIIIDESYYQSIQYAPFLILASGISTIAGFSAQVIMAQNRNKLLLVTNIFGMVVNILIVFALIDHIGLWAAVIGTLGAELVISCSRVYLIRSEFTKGLKMVELLIATIMFGISIVLYFKADTKMNAVWFLFGVLAVLYLNREMIHNIVAIATEKVRMLWRRNA